MTPDYCTFWPDRIGPADWSQCCKAHDLAYAGSGDRLAADLDLARCVLDQTGWHVLPLVMLAGVVAFGWLFRRRRNPD